MRDRLNQKEKITMNKIVLQSVEDIVLNNQLYYAILVVALVIAGVITRRYIGPEDDWIEDRRKEVFVRLNPVFKRMGRTLVVEKGIEDYVCTAHQTPDDIEDALYQCGYVENPISTRKYRVIEGHKQFAVGSMKFSDPDTDIQWHAYIFPTMEGSWTDIYQHGETDWDPSEGGSPIGHLEDKQIHGDPENVLRGCLDNRNILYEDVGENNG